MEELVAGGEKAAGPAEAPSCSGDDESRGITWRFGSFLGEKFKNQHFAQEGDGEVDGQTTDGAAEGLESSRASAGAAAAAWGKKLSFRRAVHTIVTGQRIHNEITVAPRFLKHIIYSL